MTLTSRQLPNWRTIIDVPVAAMGYGEASAMVRDALAANRLLRINFLNANNANIAAADPVLADALRRSVVLSDGAGLNLASRLLYGAPFPANLNGTDFVPHLLRQLSAGNHSSHQASLHVGLIGAAPDVLKSAAAAIADIAPALRVTAFHDGFFGPDAEPAILRALSADRPDILLVAMGTPRQEIWAGTRLGAEHAGVIMTVGALFDFLARRVPRAPSIMRRMGVEWLFRLVLEPRRLFRRYVIGNPEFVRRVLRQRARGRVEAESLAASSNRN
jgi:exopolysaccharide biosynthesis WecB/TagA/CpsF family protein